MSISSQFVGVWSLEEWSVTHKPSGKVHYPFGGNSVGHIIYTESGWVSATLMETDREEIPQDRRRLVAARMALKPPEGMPKQEIDEEQKKFIEELKERFCLSAMGYVSYCGPFDIKDNMVQHHIVNSLVPQWVGTILEREYEFAEDLLTLTADTGDFSDKLVWKRVK